MDNKAWRTSPEKEDLAGLDMCYGWITSTDSTPSASLVGSVVGLQRRTRLTTNKLKKHDQLQDTTRLGMDEAAAHNRQEEWCQSVIHAVDYTRCIKVLSIRSSFYLFQ